MWHVCPVTIVNKFLIFNSKAKKCLFSCLIFFFLLIYFHFWIILHLKFSVQCLVINVWIILWCNLQYKMFWSLDIRILNQFLTFDSSFKRNLFYTWVFLSLFFFPRKILLFGFITLNKIAAHLLFSDNLDKISDCDLEAIELKFSI